jgi:hypothetical protein
MFLKRFDGDKDGRLTEDEFLKMARTCLQTSLSLLQDDTDEIGKRTGGK